MSNRYLINEYPLQLGAAHATAKDTFLMNKGPDILYISDSTSVSSETGIPLAVNVGVLWDKDMNLWCVSAGSSNVIVNTMNVNFFQLGVEV